MAYYKIAGLNTFMDSYGRTAQRSIPYQITEPDTVHIHVQSRWPELKLEHPEYTDDVGEYMSTECSFYRQLFDFDGFRFHSSAVVVDNKAYLFSADSGTGKSTHTQLWLRLFGDRAYILNDDKPALRLENGVWYAYGTPWSGKYDISVNTRVPVAGIAMVERSRENFIEPFSGVEAIRRVMAQVNRVKARDYRIKMMKLLDLLFRKVPIWRLGCNMDLSAAILSYETMSGEEFKEK